MPAPLDAAPSPGHPLPAADRPAGSPRPRLGPVGQEGAGGQRPQPRSSAARARQRPRQSAARPALPAAPAAPPAGAPQPPGASLPPRSIRHPKSTLAPSAALPRLSPGTPGRGARRGRRAASGVPRTGKAAPGTPPPPPGTPPPPPPPKHPPPQHKGTARPAPGARRLPRRRKETPRRCPSPSSPSIAHPGRRWPRRCCGNAATARPANNRRSHWPGGAGGRARAAPHSTVPREGGGPASPAGSAPGSRPDSPRACPPAHVLPPGRGRPSRGSRAPGLSVFLQTPASAQLCCRPASRVVPNVGVARPSGSSSCESGPRV